MVQPENSMYFWNDFLVQQGEGKEIRDEGRMDVSYQLVGLVVKVSASRVEDLGFDSCLQCGDFSRSSYTSGLKIGTTVAALPGANWDWLARCWYTVTRWGRIFNLQLLLQSCSMYNSLGRSTPEIR